MYIIDRAATSFQCTMVGRGFKIVLNQTLLIQLKPSLDYKSPLFTNCKHQNITKQNISWLRCRRSLCQTILCTILKFEVHSTFCQKLSRQTSMCKYVYLFIFVPFHSKSKHCAVIVPPPAVSCLAPYMWVSSTPFGIPFRLPVQFQDRGSSQFIICK